MLTNDRRQAFNQLRKGRFQYAGGPDPGLLAEALTIRVHAIESIATAANAHHSHTALLIQSPAYEWSPPRALLGNVNGGAGNQRHPQQRHPTTGLSEPFQRQVG